MGARQLTLPLSVHCLASVVRQLCNALHVGMFSATSGSITLMKCIVSLAGIMESP